MPKVLCLILGGGKGSALYPLTKSRTKAALPFAGKYRLGDVPLSNCINSGLRQIYLLTQFNTPSLHRHVSENYHFDSFTQGFVHILASDHTVQNTNLYEGSADAVRKALDHLASQEADHFLIIHGDLLFRMDLQKLLDHHLGTQADITIAAKPVTRERAGELSALKLDGRGRVVNMTDRAGDQLPADFQLPRSQHPDQAQWDEGLAWPTALGIYLFKAEVLRASLTGAKSDFGRDIIPQAVRQNQVETYLFTGFGEQLSSLRAFYQAQIGLTAVNPAFNFYDEVMPIFAKRSILPLSKINFCSISQALVADGCIITNSTLANSIIGERSVLDSGTNLDGVIFMGADYFESTAQRERNRAEGVPHLGIGRGTVIRKAIIDKNVCIGDGCRIGADPFFRGDVDHGNYFIKDGIIVIPKGAIIPSGTVI